MQLTQPIKIVPTKEQEKVLWDLSEKCRLTYNFALAERKEAFKNGKKVGYVKQQNDLPAIKDKYPEYKQVYSKVLQYTLRILNADYKSFFALRKNGDQKAKPPRFKGKDHFTTMVYNQSGFKVEKGYVSFSHKHPSDIELKFDIPQKFEFDKVVQVSIYRSNDGDYYVSMTYEIQPNKFQPNNKYLAIDLGVTKQTMVDSDANFLEWTNRRPDKYWEPKIQEIQSRRDHCKKNSKRWKRLNNNLKRMKRISANQLKDDQHKKTTKIIQETDANVIIIGDLSVKQMAKSKKGDRKRDRSMNRGSHNSGHIGRFAKFLTYKAKKAGKRVIEVDEAYTSKDCCVCGNRQDMPLNIREYRCNYCNNVMDRDCNSSVNILLRYLKHAALWTGYQQFVGKLRKTDLLIGIVPRTVSR